MALLRCKTWQSLPRNSRLVTTPALRSNYIPLGRRQQSTDSDAPHSELKSEAPWESARGSEPSLKEVLGKVIPERQEQLKLLKSKADKKIGEVKVQNVLGGMRGLKSMLWQGSVLDADEGIRFHGHTIAELSRALPKGKTGKEMLPEGMFWLLLTGQIPTTRQVRRLSFELASKRQVPHTDVLHATSEKQHPMTQLSMAVANFSVTSTFATAYRKGELKKSDYWKYTLDDALFLIAKLPAIAAYIYRRSSRKNFEGKEEDLDKLPSFSASSKIVLDWTHNFAGMMGFGGNSENEEGFQDLLRLYLALHADHEGGNVSAHATHLVGSALSDVFLSYSAGLNGLAGPLHGLANQEVLFFIMKLRDSVSSTTDSDAIAKYLRDHLASGQVIPGYGHAVLRKPDPRFTALMDFASSRPSILADPLFQLVRKVSEIAPGVLTEHGKTKNPYPNVDAISGVLLWHYGIRDPRFYTVIFGVSRVLGPMAQLVWDRALGLPIERPKSVDMAGLMALSEEGG